MCVGVYVNDINQESLLSYFFFFYPYQNLFVCKIFINRLDIRVVSWEVFETEVTLPVPSTDTTFNERLGVLTVVSL